jgi:hypothetical protein
LLILTLEEREATTESRFPEERYLAACGRSWHPGTKEVRGLRGILFHEAIAGSHTVLHNPGVGLRPLTRCFLVPERSKGFEQAAFYRRYRRNCRRRLRTQEVKV